METANVTAMKPKPKRRMNQLHIVFRPHLYQAIKKAADDLDLPMSTWVKVAVKQALRKKSA